MTNVKAQMPNECLNDLMSKKKNKIQTLGCLSFCHLEFVIYLIFGFCHLTFKDFHKTNQEKSLQYL